MKIHCDTNNNNMKFFLDTASIPEIKKWLNFGVVDGITTNPSLLAKEGQEPLSQLTEIANLIDGPVSAQVTSTTLEKMITQGKALSQISKNIVVKVPSTENGFLAAKELTLSGINCNITLNFNPAQIIPFAKLPVAYVSLVLGRVGDFGLVMENRERISQSKHILEKLSSKTQLLAASIRNPEQLIDAIECGADVITVPPATWNFIFSNPLTSGGESDFFNAWNQLSLELREKYDDLS